MNTNKCDESIVNRHEDGTFASFNFCKSVVEILEEPGFQGREAIQARAAALEAGGYVSAVAERAYQNPRQASGQSGRSQWWATFHMLTTDQRAPSVHQPEHGQARGVLLHRLQLTKRQDGSQNEPVFMECVARGPLAQNIVQMFTEGQRVDHCDRPAVCRIRRKK